MVTAKFDLKFGSYPESFMELNEVKNSEFLDSGGRVVG